MPDFFPKIPSASQSSFPKRRIVILSARSLLSRRARVVFPAGVANTGELMFTAKESEDGRSEQHQFPKDELRSLPMIKHGHRRQRTDEKEPDLANTEQGMTQHNPTTEPDFGL